MYLETVSSPHCLKVAITRAGWGVTVHPSELMVHLPHNGVQLDRQGKVAKGAHLVFLLGGTVTRVASSMVGTLNCREQEELNRCFQTRWC
jgi:hypothetical protein